MRFRPLLSPLLCRFQWSVFFLSFAVKPAFLIFNLDSYTLNNCIHISLLTGSHPIIAGPVFHFQVVFFLVPSILFLLFGRGPPLVSLPAAYVYGCPSRSFFPCPSSRLSVLLISTHTSEFIPSLPTSHTSSTPLSGSCGTDFREKVFFHANPASFLPLALPPSRSTWAFTSVIYVYHSLSAPPLLYEL